MSEKYIRNEIERGCLDVLQGAQFLQLPDTQEFIFQSGSLISSQISLGKKILIAGNGGSLCDAMHVAEEFTGYFRKKRRAIPAIALSDPSHITCVGNDTSFEEIFSRGIEAYGVSGDVFIALTTSGNSENLARALNKANSMDLWTISLLGKSGGVMKGLSDKECIVSGFSYSDRIQEVHMAILHLIIQTVEQLLFP